MLHGVTTYSLILLGVATHLMLASSRLQVDYPTPTIFRRNAGDPWFPCEGSSDENPLYDDGEVEVRCSNLTVSSRTMNTTFAWVFVRGYPGGETKTTTLELTLSGEDLSPGVYTNWSSGSREYRLQYSVDGAHRVIIRLIHRAGSILAEQLNLLRCQQIVGGVSVAEASCRFRVYAYEDKCAPTQPTLCFNGGTCDQRLTLTGARDFYCGCSAWWTGDRCRHDVDECARAPGPCLHGGRCVNVAGAPGWFCDCPQGRSGHNCQTDVNECTSSPCENNATCENSPGTFACWCAPGFGGELCEDSVPGELTTDCPEWARLHSQVTCTCYPRDGLYGEPAAQVGWTNRSFNGSGFVFPPDPTLVIRNLTLSAATAYKCLLLWTPPDRDPVRKELRLAVRVAYGPTQADTTITGPHTLQTDGRTSLTLSCASSRVAPSLPFVWWAGVSCQAGNTKTRCTFTPSLDWGEEIRVTCLLQNRLTGQKARANFTLTLAPKGSSVITFLGIVGRKQTDGVVTRPSQKLRVKCLARPYSPFLRTASLTLQRLTADAARHRTLNHTQSFPCGPACLALEAKVTGPVCGRNDTYRCQAVGETGAVTDDAFLTLTARCVSLPRAALRGLSTRQWLPVGVSAVVGVVLVSSLLAVGAFAGVGRARRKYEEARMKRHVLAMTRHEASFTSDRSGPEETEELQRIQAEVQRLMEGDEIVVDQLELGRSGLGQPDAGQSNDERSDPVQSDVGQSDWKGGETEAQTASTSAGPGQSSRTGREKRGITLVREL